MADLLDNSAISEALRGLPGWDREGNALVRTARLPSFAAAVTVVNRVAELAERADHHPDIDIRWRNLTFRCSTHSKGGITDLDLKLARQISEQIQAAQG